MEKKSVFLAACQSVRDEKEAQSFLKARRDKYPDAGHHVYAWIVGGEGEQRLQRFSDDGEPQGTSGPPVLDVLAKGNIIDTIIVVTRYFGGILLGTGGLVKAYGSAASGVITTAGLCRMVPGRRYLIRFPYRYVDTMQYQLGLTDVVLEDKLFGSDVTFSCLVESSSEEQFSNLVSGVSLGEAEVSKGESLYLPQPVEGNTDGNNTDQRV